MDARLQRGRRGRPRADLRAHQRGLHRRRGAGGEDPRRGRPRSLERFPGSELVGLSYEPPFDFIAGSEYGEKGHTVLPADFVTAEDGTGLVHTAIAFGEDDFRLGEANGLEPINPVLPDGTYDKRITDWAGRERQGRRRADLSRICGVAASCCKASPTSTPIRTAGAATRRCSTTPSRPGTSRPARSRTACWPPTRRSTGSRRTSSMGGSASGSRATSTGRCRASVTGARRCPYGGVPLDTSMWSAHWPSSRPSPGSRSRTRTARSSTTSPSSAPSRAAPRR